MKRTPSASRTEMTEMVLPSDTNNLGTLFGGKLMQWIDLCAAMAAQRHCRLTVVTASIDDLHFMTPIHRGEIAVLTAEVNAAFRTSLEVGVVVDAEVPLTGERTRCVEAFLSFVALGADGKAAEVPALELESDAERSREAGAHERRRARLARRALRGGF